MKSQCTYASKRSHQIRTKSRQAFTLVELLVVITIIGILVALLVPAVTGVMGNARDAQMGIEVANLAQALEAYKLENMAYPPDFAPTTELQDKNQIDAHLARKFRYRVKAQDVVPMTGLDPAEALVFWLSGLSGDQKFPLLKRQPYAVGTGPVKGDKPFFEFDQARLDDRDGDGWPEYYPENSEMPYVYLSSQNYGEKQADGTYFAFSHPVLNGATGVRAYAAELSDSVVNNIRPTVRFAEQDKYQIICAGRDSQFGAGMGLKEYQAASYPDGIGYSEADEDNLTNFSEGSTLQAAIP